MTRDAAFFYQLLKPGRYLGDELGSCDNSANPASRHIVWYYPDRYERAITDPAWRRSYFQICREKGISVSRAVEYARDVWQALRARNQPVFTLDHLKDIHDAESVVFWAPDVLTAAHIPAIVRRADLQKSDVSIGVLCDGYWIPRFLLGHVDWIAPAPGGWLPRDIVSFLSDGGSLPASALSSRQVSEVESWTRAGRQPWLTPFHPAATPRWVPYVEVEDDYVDVDLGCVDDEGLLRARGLSAVVQDALDGLKGTGIDGVRFCEVGTKQSELVAAGLSELQRRHNMKRVRVHLPAVTVEQFNRDWASYRPHLLKPTARFRLTEPLDPASAIEAGNRALNCGWHGITAVLEFDSFDALSRMLPALRHILTAWKQSTQGHSDKRLLRLEYRPAPIDQWRDAPDGPDDGKVRHFSGEFGDFKENLSRSVAVGPFRIEEIIARNWMAAAGDDLWDGLAVLDLSDPNDAELPAFDWFTWVRQESGLTGPPKLDYVAIRIPGREPAPALISFDDSAPAAALDAPRDNLFGRRKQNAAPSRRLAAPPLTRMRVRWAKEMPWRLYSHLDLVRAIERAVRKAGLPAAYSEGFHPRLKLSFGPPLAFGLLSDAEYLDLLLDEEFQQSDAGRLALSFPRGLCLVEARGAAAGIPALSDAINEAVYSGIIPLEWEDAQNKIDDFHALPEVKWQRIGREDRAPVDPRKTLRTVSVEPTADGTRWDLCVLLGGEGNIRPTEWAMLLFGFTTEQMAAIVIRRMALLIRRGAQARTPFDLL